jgi:uncharacterized BrkB/YihY/UPF0761 family membrane protein
MKTRFTWNSRKTAGLLIGLLVPLLAIPLVILILSLAQNFPFILYWNKFLDSPMIRSKIISLCIIPNLGVFYFFLNRERYDIARGIIIASACFLPYILYVNLS